MLSSLFIYLTEEKGAASVKLPVEHPYPIDGPGA